MQKDQKKLLDSVLLDSFGKPAVKIGDLLYGKKNVNEFLIAKKLEMTINQIRNLLYRMSEHGLVFSSRKKDKKKGWYTYFWTLDISKTLDFLKNMLEKKKQELKGLILSRETKRFYICPQCHVEYTEENALIRDFICGECGSVLELKDNSSFILEKKKELEIVEKELLFVNSELSQERQKIGKSRERKGKREKKKKDQERAKVRAERKAALAKIAKPKVKLKKKKVKMKNKEPKKAKHSTKKKVSKKKHKK